MFDFLKQVILEGTNNPFDLWCRETARNVRNSTPVQVACYILVAGAASVVISTESPALVNHYTPAQHLERQDKGYERAEKYFRATRNGEEFVAELLKYGFTPARAIELRNAPIIFDDGTKNEEVDTDYAQIVKRYDHFVNRIFNDPSYSFVGSLPNKKVRVTKNGLIILSNIKKNVPTMVENQSFLQLKQKQKEGIKLTKEEKIAINSLDEAEKAEEQVRKKKVQDESEKPKSSWWKRQSSQDVTTKLSMSFQEAEEIKNREILEEQLNNTLKIANELPVEYILIDDPEPVRPLKIRPNSQIAQNQNQDRSAEATRPEEEKPKTKPEVKLRIVLIDETKPNRRILLQKVAATPTVPGSASIPFLIFKTPGGLFDNFKNQDEVANRNSSYRLYSQEIVIKESTYSSLLTSPRALLLLAVIIGYSLPIWYAWFPELLNFLDESLRVLFHLSVALILFLPVELVVKLIRFLYDKNERIYEFLCRRADVISFELILFFLYGPILLVFAWFKPFLLRIGLLEEKKMLDEFQIIESFHQGLISYQRAYQLLYYEFGLSDTVIQSLLD